VLVQEYLNASNHKPGIFRDVINEAEYNPMQCTNKNIKVPVHDLEDPCKFDATKAKAEQTLVCSRRWINFDV
jgi:hypothetical protein